MKTLFTILVFAISVQVGMAQTITVKNEKLLNKLRTLVGDCLSGNQLDTACAALHNNVRMVCNGSDFSIEGNSAIYSRLGESIFSCGEIDFSDLPPNIELIQLEDEWANYNEIGGSYITLMNFPPNLKTLILQGNHLEIDTLPESVETIILHGKIPEAGYFFEEQDCDGDCMMEGSYTFYQLPRSLKTLYISHSNAYINGDFPTSIDLLTIDGNKGDIVTINGESVFVSSFGRLNIPKGWDGVIDSMNIYRVENIPFANFPNNVNNLSLIDVPTEFATSFVNSLVVNHSNIKGLNLGSIQGITSLPTLPKSLEYLECSYLDIPTFSQYPTLLKGLSLRGNSKLTSLSPFPSSLESFTSRNNTGLTNFPNLPSSLHYFYTEDDSNIISLPPFPSTVGSLYIYNTIPQNNLPSFPLNLKALGLSNIPPQLIVETLPENLEFLKMEGIKDYDYSKLPITLKELRLISDSLLELPELHDELEILDVSKNKLKFIDKLPSHLKELDVTYNQELTCLPYLPDSLRSIYSYNTQITCYPNNTKYRKFNTICTDGQDICNGEVFSSILGSIYYDINNNGMIDAGDKPIQNSVIKINGGKYTLSDSYGKYGVRMNTYGTYTIAPFPNNPHIISVTPPSKTVVYDENYNRDSVHFLIQLDIKNDVRIEGVNMPARPGMQTSVSAFVNNYGIAKVSNLKVKIKKPQGWELISAEPSGFKESNDTLIWNNISIYEMRQSNFGVKTKLPATATILGDAYMYEMWVENNGEEVPEDNYYQIIDTIRGSYDPNDKIVNHSTLSPENYDEQDLIYTIRFQNTGTDTAFNVVILDTIAGNLDPASIRVLGASHSYTWQFYEQGIAEFTFNKILLPDSNVNEPASHGYVTLAVKAQKELAAGDSIYNRAGIYFDYNEPVITNKALTRVATATSVYLRDNTSINIYPNPARDQVRIEWDIKDKATLQLFDLSGKLMYSKILHRNFTDIDVSKLPKGMYLIQLQNSQVVATGKLLIQ